MKTRGADHGSHAGSTFRVATRQCGLTSEDGATVEVGVIGIDGVVGLPILLGAESMPGETFIQVSASGFRIDAQRLKSEFERNGKLRDHLQKYLLANLIQSAQNAPVIDCTASVSVSYGGYLPVMIGYSPIACR